VEHRGRRYLFHILYSLEAVCVFRILDVLDREGETRGVVESGEGRKDGKDDCDK
jgi:hypothetical protein